MKNFVKPRNKSGEGFKYLQNLFQTISSAKLNEGIFIGPDIRKVITDSLFIGKLGELERNAWMSFVEVIRNSLGNIRSVNYMITLDNKKIFFAA